MSRWPCCNTKTTWAAGRGGWVQHAFAWMQAGKGRAPPLPSVCFPKKHYRRALRTPSPATPACLQHVSRIRRLFSPPLPLLAVLAVPVALMPARVQAAQVTGCMPRILVSCAAAVTLPHSSWGSSSSQEQQQLAEERKCTWRGGGGWGWTAAEPPTLAAAACPAGPGRMSAA